MRYDGKKRPRQHPKHACICGPKGFKRDGNCLADHKDLLAVGDPASRRGQKPGRRRLRRDWCRGKIGVQHQARWQLYLPYGRPRDEYRLVCSVCKKKFWKTCNGLVLLSHAWRSLDDKTHYQFKCECGNHTLEGVRTRVASEMRRAAKWRWPGVRRPQGVVIEVT